jgi:RNA ligase (TIGR02306 family)
MRKLATIRRVLDLSPIEGADAIECATVDGWRTVVKKGEFKVGDLAVYFEIDSWIPKAVAPFLFKGKILDGVEGARLQTVRLRGQLSQGLLLPLVAVVHLTPHDGTYYEGDDMTEVFGIQLWEPPPPKQQSFQSGRPAGNFPAFLRKTDQERVQNLRRELGLWAAAGEQWEVTEKLDGTSFTAFKYEGRTGVCSRNYELKADDDGAPGLYWQVARDSGIFDAFDEGYAVQGEILGPGICGNKYGLTAPHLYVFDVFDIAQQRYLTPEERAAWHFDNMRRNTNPGWHHVPVLGVFETPGSVDETLAMANRTSVIADVLAEGIVLKNVRSQQSLKAVSDRWLLHYKA